MKKLLTLIALLTIVVIANPQTLIKYSSVTFAWDASPSPEVAGYRLYSGPTSGTYTNSVDVGTPLEYTATNVVREITMYYAVTAYSTNGLESDFSNEVSYTPPITSTLSTVKGTRLSPP